MNTSSSSYSSNLAMSFDVSFYKDHLLNKVGEFKARASAALKHLDGCDVKLTITTTTAKQAGNMPHRKNVGIKNRAKSKCKHSHSHTREVERTYKSGHRDHSCGYSSDSDSDCSSYDDCCPCDCDNHRGRSPCRIPVYGGNGDGPNQQNVNQQNNNNIFLPGYCERGSSRHRRHRSRSQPIIVISQREHWRGHHDSSRTNHPAPRHWDGRCCIHGYGPLHLCMLCPPSGRQWHSHHFLRGGFVPIVDDNGKVDLWKHESLVKKLEDQNTKAKQEKDKKDAEEKKEREERELLNRALKQNAFGGPMVGGRPAWIWPAQSGYERSAEDIRFELEKLRTDREQLHARAILEAKRTADVNEAEVLADEYAMCSGALQGSDNQGVQYVEQKKPLRSILATPRKFGRFDWKNFSRVEEVDDKDGETHECDCGKCVPYRRFEEAQIPYE